MFPNAAVNKNYALTLQNLVGIKWDFSQSSVLRKTALNKNGLNDFRASKVSCFNIPLTVLCLARHFLS